MFQRLKAWYWKRREQRAIDEVRFALYLFGYDTSELSDEEIKRRIEEGCARMAEAWNSMAVSADEAARGLERLARAVDQLASTKLSCETQN